MNTVPHATAQRTQFSGIPSCRWYWAATALQTSASSQPHRQYTSVELPERWYVMRADMQKIGYGCWMVSPLSYSGRWHTLQRARLGYDVNIYRICSGIRRWVLSLSRPFLWHFRVNDSRSINHMLLLHAHSHVAAYIDDDDCFSRNAGRMNMRLVLKSFSGFKRFANMLWRYIRRMTFSEGKWNRQ